MLVTLSVLEKKIKYSSWKNTVALKLRIIDIVKSCFFLQVLSLKPLKQMGTGQNSEILQKMFEENFKKILSVVFLVKLAKWASSK